MVGRLPAVFLCDKGYDLRRKALAIALVVIGLALIGFGASMIVPDFLSLGDYRKLSSEVKRDDSGADDGKDDTEGDNGEKGSKKGPEDVTDTSGDDGGFTIDWPALEEEVVDSRAWVSVDGTDIDFPVVQGNDNEWYLYHDAFGRESYANVFLDYRCNPNGTNAIVYAHTHWADTGFHQIAEVDEQGHFDDVGTVWYSTPEEGTLAFTPVAGLHVWPDFADVQQFDFSPDETEVAIRMESDLAEHAARGEWNLCLLADQMPAAPIDQSILVGTKRAEADLAFWWVMSDGDVAEIRRDCAMSSYHTWLRNLAAQGSAHADNWEELVSSSERCLVLACCSWPFDSHRTLLVCVR